MSNINGQFKKGRTKTGGRAKGTPNKKTTELMELLGDYNPIVRLIEIAKNENTSPWYASQNKPRFIALYLP